MGEKRGHLISSYVESLIEKGITGGNFAAEIVGETEWIGMAKYAQWLIAFVKSALRPFCRQQMTTPNAKVWLVSIDERRHDAATGGFGLFLKLSHGVAARRVVKGVCAVVAHIEEITFVGWDPKYGTQVF
jgi:hypothetical protein